MAWPAVKLAIKPNNFNGYVHGLPVSKWRPSMVVLHNTAAPTWKQWHESAEKDRMAGRIPGITRINALENYFKNEQHWSGAPHLFIADDVIWVFNPLTAPGVHSPSWNSISIGIEMIADYDVEDDDSGPGLLVRRNAVLATAVLCSTFGIDAAKVVKLHRDDPKTTHACPGKDFADDRKDVIASIIEEVGDLMDGGEHDPRAVAIAGTTSPAPTAPASERSGVVTVVDLNVRRGPGITNDLIGTLPLDLRVSILDQASNGTTGWLKIKTPGGYVGWVAGRYVKQTEGK